VAATLAEVEDPGDTVMAGEGNRGNTAKAGDVGRGDVGSFTPPSSLPDDRDHGVRPWPEEEALLVREVVGPG